VPLPIFAVLEVPRALTDAFLATGDPDLGEFAESFQRQGETCFGSRHLGGVTQKWSSSLRHRITDCDTVLARLLVFDAFIENGDRSASTAELRSIRDEAIDAAVAAVPDTLEKLRMRLS